MENKYRSIRKTVFAYLAFSVTWIFVTDSLVARFVPSQLQTIQLSMVKGIAFVVGSSLVIYLTMLAEQNRRKRVQEEYSEELSRLLAELRGKHAELSEAYDSTIEGWANALELRDGETGGHSRRVLKMMEKMGACYGFSEETMNQIRRGAILHDIGKMGIPDSILLKPGPLTPQERATIQKHTLFGVQLLASIAFLKPCLDIPHYHHERWDGSGYPNGLKAEQIPLPARIFAVIDVCDALRSNRPYRPAFSKEETLEYILEQSGKMFDPQVVQAFLALNLIEMLA